MVATDVRILLSEALGIGSWVDRYCGTGRMLCEDVRAKQILYNQPIGNIIVSNQTSCGCAKYVLILR
jgi:hypothetical protein